MMDMVLEIIVNLKRMKFLINGKKLAMEIDKIYRGIKLEKAISFTRDIPRFKASRVKKLTT